jgi:hypothetical protein
MHIMKSRHCLFSKLGYFIYKYLESHLKLRWMQESQAYFHYLNYRPLLGIDRLATPIRLVTTPESWSWSHSGRGQQDKLFGGEGNLIQV